MSSSPFIVKQDDQQALPPGMIGLPRWYQPPAAPAGQPAALPIMSHGITGSVPPVAFAPPLGGGAPVAAHPNVPEPPAPGIPPDASGLISRQISLPVPTSGNGEIADINRPQPAAAPSTPSVGPGATEFNRLAASKPGWEQIHNPFLKVGAGIGNALLSTFAPRAAAVIPGTTAHHEMLLDQAGGAGEQERAQQKATEEAAAAPVARAATEAHTGLENAEAGNYISEVEARANPALKEVQGPVIDPNDPTRTPRIGWTDEHGKPGNMVYGPPVGAHPAAAEPNKTTFEKMDDGTVLALSVKDGVPTHTVVYKGDPKVESDLAKLKINGQEHSVIVNKKTGETIKDLGETGEKPPVVNVNAETSALDRESARFAKTHEANVKAANDKLEKIVEARSLLTTGTAESQALAIPKVLTALISGQGTGVRITQPELNAIGAARGIKGDLQGWIQKISSGKKLTPDQQQQLIGVLDEASKRLEQKRAISDRALDTINSAESKADIVKADTDARKALADFEKGAGVPHKIANDAEFNALPKGAHFIGPDGKERVKP